MSHVPVQLMKTEHDSELKIQRSNSELQKEQNEKERKMMELKQANEQINLLTREKGVAMRDNAASYEQSIQKESQVQTLIGYSESSHV